MPGYPALLDLASQKLHLIGGSASFLVGRNETADVCVLDRTCSRHHFRIVRRDGRYQVEPLSPQNPTYHNGQPVASPAPVEHGALLQAGQARFQFLLRPAGADTARQVTSAAAVVPAAPAGAESLEAASFPLAGTML